MIQSGELKVYTTRWCSDCRIAKRFLDEYDVPYEDVDIAHDLAAAEELVQRTGVRGVPHFVLRGRWIKPYHPGSGFLHDEMAAVLGLKGNGAD